MRDVDFDIEVKMDFNQCFVAKPISKRKRTEENNISKILITKTSSPKSGEEFRITLEGELAKEDQLLVIYDFPEYIDRLYFKPDKNGYEVSENGRDGPKKKIAVNLKGNEWVECFLGEHETKFDSAESLYYITSNPLTIFQQFIPNMGIQKDISQIDGQYEEAILDSSKLTNKILRHENQKELIKISVNRKDQNKHLLQFNISFSEEAKMELGERIEIAREKNRVYFKPSENGMKLSRNASRYQVILPFIRNQDFLCFLGPYYSLSKNEDKGFFIQRSNKF